MSKEDENDKDLDFWMDSDTSTVGNDISDDDSTIDTVISPNSLKTKSKNQKKSPNTKFRKRNRSININSSEDDDDVIIEDGPPNLYQTPKEFRQEIEPFENYYEPPIAKSRESQALEFAVESLKNDIDKMLKEDDDDDHDDNIHVPQVPAPVLKNEGDLTLIFAYPPEDFQEERILRAGQPFMSAFQTLPEKFEDFHVKIDGVTYDPKEVLNELLLDYTKVTLVEPEQTNSLKGLKLLAIVLPSGEKKKLALDPNSTFREILTKLNLTNVKLMFDGEELNLNQKISQNDDLEDGDQLDVAKI